MPTFSIPRILVTRAGSARKPEAYRATLAHGQAALPKPCRACPNVPAFIFFFQMLYPFKWVNLNVRLNSVAAAAGGCMLVRTDALASAGGYRPRSWRADRRLRAGQRPEAARADLGRIDHSLARRREYPTLADIGE